MARIAEFSRFRSNQPWETPMATEALTTPKREPLTGGELAALLELLLANLNTNLEPFDNFQSQLDVSEQVGQTIDFHLAITAIKELKAGLNRVMEWRNAFAHGKVLHEHKAGYVLQYYSGGRQELVLDDAFFDRVESTLRNCLYTCNGVIQAR